MSKGNPKQGNNRGPRGNNRGPKGGRGGHGGPQGPGGGVAVKERPGPTLDIRELKEMSIAQLVQIGKDLNVEGASGTRKQELIFKILQNFSLS